MNLLVLISGPIAAGKSTLAREVARQLRELGRTVALVELDTVAEMALPTLPDWDWAHSIHAGLVGAWSATPIEVVLDEGTETPAEVAQVLRAVPEGAPVLKVVLVADVERSWERAQGDPTRGLSKDRDFLTEMYERFAAGLPELERDLLLDVEATSLEERVVAVVTEAVRRLAVP
ncbi:hypothetical protein Bcav_2760 [Beutenbergia cavernae DSM 12333]|uniref:Adenylylsulfate kinase n=1 Tax=Beutenbergia cavernae (strain ATCC BAA-8 / DSM 12333 / CCUG 43141 / JCM 11478 / NBRC 16432 / NCIMB 13614 / HKI 0122) TaxID=471853 RepID=C5BYA5_BEUC1|nr:AAA family ATPase [Beutenbergia cavernae]ACQ81005.1 hypothetical protein Bcav_2760 [Beutenbergia cavernae DSM 12333]